MDYLFSKFIKYFFLKIYRISAIIYYIYLTNGNENNQFIYSNQIHMSQYTFYHFHIF